MKKLYFEVHVFYTRKDGYSVHVCVESDEDLLEEEVIDEAVKQGKIDESDAECVDYVRELDESEYVETKQL